MCGPHGFFGVDIHPTIASMRMEDIRVGVDLGGTKTEAVLLRVGGEIPEVLDRERIATERDGGYDHVLSRVAALIARFSTRAPAASIGVGMPGGLTRAGLVKNSNTTCLNGRPFHEDLRRAVGRPIAFDNDANCFALAELAFGAARGAGLAFGVILGTGVGGGVVLGGPPRVHRGPHGIAGEWGHVVIDPSGPACYCGRRGCVETYLCGPAIERRHAARTGRTQALADIDDPVTLAEVAEIFGRSLAIVVNVLDPDVLVLGGGVSNLPLLYDEGLRALARHVFDDEPRVCVVKNALGDSAGVFGAAMLR